MLLLTATESVMSGEGLAARLRGVRGSCKHLDLTREAKGLKEP